MLFPDLSAPEINNSNKFKQEPAIAFVVDRFIALILDFLIISPTVSLLLAGLVRQTKTFFLLNAQSEQGVVAAGLIFATTTVVVVLIQAISLYFLQATPGQYFCNCAWFRIRNLKPACRPVNAWCARWLGVGVLHFLLCRSLRF